MLDSKFRQCLSDPIARQKELISLNIGFYIGFVGAFVMLGMALIAVFIMDRDLNSGQLIAVPVFLCQAMYSNSIRKTLLAHESLAVQVRGLSDKIDKLESSIGK